MLIETPTEKTALGVGHPESIATLAISARYSQPTLAQTSRPWQQEHRGCGKRHAVVAAPSSDRIQTAIRIIAGRPASSVSTE